MIEVTKNKGESFEALMRRFRKSMTMSGKLLQAKKTQYFKRTKSKNLQKNSALVRNKMAAKRTYLIKSGKATEDDFRGRGKKKRR